MIDCYGWDPAEHSACCAATIEVPTPEDVVLSKLEWHRKGDEVSDRQWRDVLGLMKIQGARLDHAYLKRWANELGISDLLKRARASAQE